MSSNEVLEIIISFVKAVKNTSKEKNPEECFYLDDGNHRIWAAKYLLGQIIRNYSLDGDKFFVSVAAKNKWAEITNDDVAMKDYNYTKGIPVRNKVYLDLYKGAANAPFAENKEFDNGTTVQYRQVFHDEHVIPIDTIIKRLVALDEADLTHDNVEKILNGIYVCRMLKSENAKLNKGYKNKRLDTVKATIEEIYINKCHIEIENWEEIKTGLS